ncbi:cell surface glycoprotein MUC18-like isoform X2 [Microplitis demolitor]|uniref:cell surface glycoprotein MUC18-like isoform X2 n=1 Tax=Microplitis demolitor TaxID=69319 RepID=UPI0004CD5A2F|nr:cell surface glycoprotein MUC18-like isoform X2 [Microplitis demolitor]XP_008546439.1 cell surface glycoprotein MUC18-like isoform X2 [Microplitis demolitor]
MAPLLQAFTLFLILSICRADKPKIEPSDPILDINEDGKLFIKCRSNKAMKFYIVLDNPKQKFSETIELATMSNNLFLHTIIKPSVVLGDSGWYGCANSDVKVDTSQHDQLEVSWIHVNVKPIKPLMEPEGSEMLLTEGDRLLIKCHSDKEMISYSKLNNPDKASESSEDSTTQDENLFTLSIEKKSVVPEDSGWYGCANKDVSVDTERFNQPEVRWIFVNVKSKKPLMEPSGPILNLNEGEELLLKCRSHQDMTFFTVLDNPGQESENIEESSTFFEGIYTVIFKKNSVLQGDSGWYGCAYSDVDVDTSNRDQLGVNWINVVVKPQF